MMSKGTPFYYAASPFTIVAVIPDEDGVLLTADEQLSDGSWRDVCDLRFTWSEFKYFTLCMGQIVGDPPGGDGEDNKFLDRTG